MGTSYRTASRLTDRDRFWLRVSPTDTCWLWAGATDSSGYGIIGGQHAHRRAWELVHGPIGDRRVYVCHRCDNPPCCNPDHLFLGSAADNNADKAAKGRTPRVLTLEQGDEIRRRYAIGARQNELALAYGVSKGTIYNVLRGIKKCWQ